MDIFKKVKSLKLPQGKYVVFGSGPLAAHGIKEVRDIDLVVTPDVYDDLKSEGWKEETWPSGRKYLVKGEFEAVKDWDFRFVGNYYPDVRKLISEAEIIEGVPFVRLEEVLKWKKAYGRDKDKKDIKSIENFLSNILK